METYKNSQDVTEIGETLLSYYERLKVLNEFGLTDNQAKVYLALLSFDTALANQIPSVSQVPRTKIYEIMRQLHEKGLVQIIPETPLRYKAVPFEKYLEKRINELRDRLNELETSKGELIEGFKLVHREPEEQGRFEVFYGRRNVRDKLKEMYSLAREEILTLGTEKAPARIMKTLLYDIEDKKEEGVQLKFAFPITDSNIDRIARLSEFGTIKHLEKGPMINLTIIDNSQCIMIHRIPDDENPVKGEDTALWTNDSAIVNAMKDVAANFYNQSLNYRNFKAVGPLLISIGSWLNSIEIDSSVSLELLGKSLGEQIASTLTSDDKIGLFKELGEFWEKHHLGKVEVVQDEPLIIAMDNYLNCWEKPEISDAMCSFVKSLVETIVEEKLELKCKVEGYKCPTESQSYCKLRISTS